MPLSVITDAGVATFLDNAHTVTAGLLAGWLAYALCKR